MKLSAMFKQPNTVLHLRWLSDPDMKLDSCLNQRGAGNREKMDSPSLSRLAKKAKLEKKTTTGRSRKRSTAMVPISSVLHGRQQPNHRRKHTGRELVKIPLSPWPRCQSFNQRIISCDFKAFPLLQRPPFHVDE
jgi:hypothetical protein